MVHRIGIVVFIAGMLLSPFTRESRAADQEALVQQMTAFNKAAVTAYSNGDFDKAKGQLMQAIALGKKDSSLLTHPLMARTYLHLGVLFVDGFEDRKAGVKYFVKALKIRSDIEVTDALATKTVKSAFLEASGEAGPAEASPAEGTESATGGGSAKDDKASRAVAVKEEKSARDDEKQSSKAVAAEKTRAAAESKESERQAREEKDKLMKELAQAGGSEAKERAAKEKLQTEKQERDKLLAETKEALQKLQKETKEQEKQAQAEKDKLGKELAQVRDSEGKERAAKEKLQTEKQEKEKQLAEAKAQIQQLQKEKAEKEKQLADTGGREKKERETREKLEKDKQAAEAHEKERKAQEESQRLEREKLAAGPDLPSRFSEPIYCSVPDEAQAGQDLFVHCVAQPHFKAKEIALYYRSSGGVHYNSVAMEPSKKGWQAAVIPANRVSGKLLQYYMEARDGRGTVAASNGKASSPNILTLRPAGGAAGRDHGKAR